MTIPFLSKSFKARTYADFVEGVTLLVRDSGVRDGAHGTLVADPLALRSVSVHRAACVQAESELGARPPTHVLRVRAQAAARRVGEANRRIADFQPLGSLARGALGLGLTLLTVGGALASRAAPELVAALGIAAIGTVLIVTEASVARWWRACGLSLARRRFDTRRDAHEVAEARAVAFDARVEELVAQARVQIVATYGYATSKGQRFVAALADEPEPPVAAGPESSPTEDSAVRRRLQSGRIN